MKKLVLLTFFFCLTGVNSFAQTAVKNTQHALIAYMKVIPGSEKTFLQLAQEVIIKSRREPGNLVYILQQSIKEPNQFVFYEVFKTDADLEFHKNSTHVKTFLEKTKPLVLPGQFLLEKYQNLMTSN